MPPKTVGFMYHVAIHRARLDIVEQSRRRRIFARMLPLSWRPYSFARIVGFAEPAPNRQSKANFRRLPPGYRPTPSRLILTPMRDFNAYARTMGPAPQFLQDCQLALQGQRQDAIPAPRRIGAESMSLFK